MRKIFVGLLFLLFNFHVNLGSVRLEMIPDFVGYLIMLAGLSEMAGYSPRFGKMKPFAVGLAIYDGVIFILALLGVVAEGNLDLFFLPLGLIASVLHFYVLYNIIQGVAQIETDRRQDLGSRTLHVIWLVRIVVSAVALVPFLGIPALIGSIIASICFLVAFYGAMKKFYAP